MEIIDSLPPPNYPPPTAPPVPSETDVVWPTEEPVASRWIASGTIHVQMGLFGATYQWRAIMVANRVCLRVDTILSQKIVGKARSKSVNCYYESRQTIFWLPLGNQPTDAEVDTTLRQITSQLEKSGHVRLAIDDR